MTQSATSAVFPLVAALALGVAAPVPPACAAKASAVHASGTLAVASMPSQQPPAPGPTPATAAPAAPGDAPAPSWRDLARKEAMDIERLSRMLDAGDKAMIIQTFRRYPAAVLPFIDDDLEGGLAVLEEAAKDPTLHARPLVAAKHRWDRAIKFAELANQAFGEIIFEEYAGAFASWTPTEQKRFRAGQASFRQGRELAKSDAEAALPHLRRSLVIADGLGDHWGVAMSQLAIAEACEKLGRTKEGHDAAVKAIELFGRLQLKPSYVKALTTCARLRQQMEVPDMGSGQLRMALQALPPEAPTAQRQAIVDELAALLEKMGRKDEVERLLEQERSRAEALQGTE